jgi:hypothetical protein
VNTAPNPTCLAPTVLPATNGGVFTAGTYHLVHYRTLAGGCSPFDVPTTLRIPASPGTQFDVEVTTVFQPNVEDHRIETWSANGKYLSRSVSCKDHIGLSQSWTFATKTLAGKPRVELVWTNGSTFAYQLFERVGP